MNEVADMKAIGVDVGGSGCRLAVVNVHTGRIEGDVERLSHDVNTPAEPILDALRTALNRMPDLPVGLGFPGRVHGTTVRTAPNLRSTWPGTDLAGHLARPDLVVLNDADAAAVAEVRLGSAADEAGTVLTVTVGTGLGSGLHRNGRLVPGCEFGLLPHPTRGDVLETHASGRARDVEGLDLAAWADRFNEALAVMETAVDADLIVVGGGITEHWEAFETRLRANAAVRKARFGPDAGVIGAALMAGHLNA